MCDTLVIVGDERVWFAKNSDRDPNEAQCLDWLPARDYAPGSQLHCTWRLIPQARHTHAIVISRPFWMWGAEMGVNEFGVAIGNEAVFTRAAFSENGLTGMDLVRLGLERGASAAEACQVIASLIGEYGQGGRAGYSDPGFRYHNSFIIADRREAFVLESAGRETASERISHGVRSISNGLTLPALSGQADRLRSRVARCATRRQRTTELGQQVRQVRDLAGVLRDHGPGREQPRWRRLNGAMDAPCMHYGGWLAGSQTVASWISELGPAGDRHWVTGTSAPCLSLFRPLDFNQPAAAGQPRGTPDSHSLWWRFERLHRKMLRDPSAARAMLAERDALETAAFATPGDWQQYWQEADAWLDRWRQHFDGALPPDQRPDWLRRRWMQVERECVTGNRLPPRRG